MNWFEVILIVICIALVICPTKWDPAIQLKEWLDNKRRNLS